MCVSAAQVNVTFSHAQVETTGCFSGSCDAQSADFLSSGAIHLEDSQSWLFDGVTVSHVGGYGFWVNLGCSDNVLVSVPVHCAGSIQLLAQDALSVACNLAAACV